MSKRTLIVLSFAGLLGLPVARAEDKADEQAKQVAEQFFKAARAKDVVAIEKMTDVPWLHDFKYIVKKSDDLKRRFPVTANDFAEKSLELKEILSYTQFLEKYKEKLGEERSKMLSEVLSKGDRLLFFPDGKKTIIMLVRIRDGQAKIVGLDY